MIDIHTSTPCSRTSIFFTIATRVQILQDKVKLIKFAFERLRQMQSDAEIQNNTSYLIIQVHKDMFPTTEQFNMQHLEALKNIRL